MESTLKEDKVRLGVLLCSINKSLHRGHGGRRLGAKSNTSCPRDSQQRRAITSHPPPVSFHKCILTLLYSQFTQPRQRKYVRRAAAVIYALYFDCVFLRGGRVGKKLWLKRWDTFGMFKMQNRTHLLNEAREVTRFPALAGSLNASQQWPQLDSWKTCALPRTVVPLGAFSSPHTEERNQRKVKPNLGLFFFPFSLLR